MILLTIFAIIFVALMIFSIIAISAGGAAFIIIFGDVIVCAIFIAWIIKRLITRKKK